MPIHHYHHHPFIGTKLRLKGLILLPLQHVRLYRCFMTILEMSTPLYVDIALLSDLDSFNKG